MEDTNTYTAVEDGFHDCKIVFAKRAEKHFGKDINGHVVTELWLVPTDCPEVENPASYRAELPLLIVPGLEWDFYDKESGRGVWRKATAADTKEVLDYAAKCFPAWKEYCESLTDGNEDLAFGWFADRNYTDGVTVRAKLAHGKPYVGTDGLDHEDLRAKIYAPFEAKPLVADDEKAQIAKALKSAGVKLFGKAAEPTKKTTPKTTPKPPPKPAKPAVSVEKLQELAFENYQRTHSDDKTGQMFYPEAAKIIGKDVNSWEAWTAGDWQNIANAFDIPF